MGTYWVAVFQLLISLIFGTTIRNYKAELFAFGARLGEQFEDAILREALTDQSYIHKERKKQEELDIDTASLDIKNNDELAELGRSVTEDVLLKFVRNEIPLFPAEGHK